MVESITLENAYTGATLTLTQEVGEFFILDNVDWGKVESTHHSYSFVNQIGEYVTSTSLDTRNVTVTGWVIADDVETLEGRKMFLSRFVDPRYTIVLTYQDYKLEFLPDTSIEYPNSYSENSDVACKFVIDGYCADPLFMQKDDSLIEAASTEPMFHFPLTISETPDPPGGVVFGLRQPSKFVEVVNEGEVETGMKIVFKALGTVVNPSLTSASTLEFFKVNKTMTAGEEIVVNTNPGSKSIIGKIDDTEKNYFKYRDLDSEWLQLSVGLNIFRYDADKNEQNLDVYIYFNNRYLEVQKCS